MNELINSPPQSIRDGSWISAVAADGELSHADARAAIAVAHLVDECGSLRGKTAALADACRIDRRRIAGHLRRLADAGYIRLIDMSRPGRFNVEIVLVEAGSISPFSTDPIERRQCATAVASTLASMEDGD